MKMKKMIGAVCLGALLSACGGDQQSAQAPVLGSILLHGKALQDEVEEVRAANGFPGLSVVVVEEGEAEAVTTGKRVIDGTVPVAPTDQFALASLSKNVTALMIGRLVEQKKLRWDHTLAELFPAWSAEMDASLRSVTVANLLNHRAGLQRDIEEADAIAMFPVMTGNLTADRTTFTKFVLKKAPVYAPNTKYSYSNVGYMVLGVIAEAVGNDTYANLMQKEVFAPLGVNGAFGFPEDTGPGALSGHHWNGTAWIKAVYSPELRLQLALLAPGAQLMVSMADYGKLLNEHLKGLQGKSTYLSQDTFRLIHTPVEGYGYGWLVGDDPALGRVSYHYGSIGSYYSSTMVVPGTKVAIAAVCNCASPVVKEKLDQLVKKLAAGRK